MKIKCFLLVLISLFIFSCSQKKSSNEGFKDKTSDSKINYEEAPSMTPNQEYEQKEKKELKDDKDLVVSGDTTTKIDRKFVRTAEMKYQVKDVFKASTDIEHLTAKYDGFITYSYLSSSITGRSYKNISTDSILETVFYTVSSEINLRVPNYSLDSMLYELNKLVEFLDYKIIKADDVSMLMYSNLLNQKRIEKNQKRITEAIDKTGKKLNDILNAEEKLLNKQEQSDFYKTSNMNLMDQVAFSTVKMHIYQREVVKRTVIENFDNIKDQRPGFFLRIWNSIKIGWSVVEDITVGLFVIWWVFVLLLIGWFILVKSIKRNKQKKAAQKQNNAEK